MLKKQAEELESIEHRVKELEKSLKSIERNMMDRKFVYLTGVCGIVALLSSIGLLLFNILK